MKILMFVFGFIIFGCASFKPASIEVSNEIFPDVLKLIEQGDKVTALRLLQENDSEQGYLLTVDGKDLYFGRKEAGRHEDGYKSFVRFLHSVRKCKSRECVVNQQKKDAFASGPYVASWTLDTLCRKNVDYHDEISVFLLSDFGKNWKPLKELRNEICK